jgi:poly-gamma-glutamate capsule biosynthesis protein CapA/YwtB (metallophosphatase superfamily)
MTTIVIGGDIYPVGNIQKAFMEGNAEEIFHDLLDDITHTDLSIVNLESPLVSKEMPIVKPGGAVLGASIKSINGFIASKWNVLNLANNHSFDHGAQGLMETIRTIKVAGLAYVGAGSNIEEALKPFIKEINGERIVIYSMAEREYSIADEKTPGANPLDLINFVNAIRQHKQQGIFIVLIHGGKEYYPFPSPEMVRRCRFMVDMGADAVICCHTHCPLPWEIYADRPIVYSLGNLIFEASRKMSAAWYEGYLAKLIFEENNIRLEVIPYVQSLTNVGAQKMDKYARKRFLDEMERKSNQVKDGVFLEAQWVKYCRQQKNIYLSGLFGYNKLMRKLRRLLLPLLHSKGEMHRALLLVQCETHQEILNTIFKHERNS